VAEQRALFVPSWAAEEDPDLPPEWWRDRGAQMHEIWSAFRRNDIKIVSRGTAPSWGSKAADTAWVGYCGAAEFAARYELPFDWKKYQFGDGGIDGRMIMRCEDCLAEGRPTEYEKLLEHAGRLRIGCERHGCSLVRTIQIKTFRDPLHQLVKEGKAEADIFVLAQFVEPARARFLKWCWRDDVLRFKPRRWPYQTMNHVIPAEDPCMLNMDLFHRRRLSI
jgi:hypothetical protein